MMRHDPLIVFWQASLKSHPLGVHVVALMLLTPSSLDQTTSILKRIAIRLAERERQALAELCIPRPLKSATEGVAQQRCLERQRGTSKGKKNGSSLGPPCSDAYSRAPVRNRFFVISLFISQTHGQARQSQLDARVCDTRIRGASLRQ